VAATTRVQTKARPSQTTDVGSLSDTPILLFGEGSRGQGVQLGVDGESVGHGVSGPFQDPSPRPYMLGTMRRLRLHIAPSPDAILRYREESARPSQRFNFSHIQTPTNAHLEKGYQYLLNWNSPVVAWLSDQFVLLLRRVHSAHEQDRVSVVVTDGKEKWAVHHEVEPQIRR